VSEPVPCPTCGALLRLPPGQAMVRCPGCKTVLAVEPIDALLPPAAPVPPPATAPLPFGGPRKPPVKAAPAIPRPAAPVPPKAGPRNPFDSPVPADEAATERKRKQKIRDELAELDEDERRQERRYDRILHECRQARSLLTFLGYGALATCLSAVFYFFFSATTIIIAPLFPLVWIASLLLVAHWILTLIGFGYGLVGSRGIRTYCGVGLAITILQAVGAVFLAIMILRHVVVAELGYESNDPRSYSMNSLLFSNAFNNLSSITDLPIYLITGGVTTWFLIALPVVGALLEFTKISIIGMVTNRLCMEGKSQDLASQGMRFVYRIFGLVVISAMLKIGVWIAVKFTGGDPLLLDWFAIPVVMISNGYFMWWAYAWYALYQTQNDALDVVVAERFADKRERLDVV